MFCMTGQATLENLNASGGRGSAPAPCQGFPLDPYSGEVCLSAVQLTASRLAYWITATKKALDSIAGQYVSFE